MSTLDREVAREFGLEIVKMIEGNNLPPGYSDGVLESIGIRAFRRALEIAGEQDYGERGES